MARKAMSDRDKYMNAVMLQRLEREASTTPVPSRITTALDVCGLYGPDVDRACGVEEPTVDRWEAGEVVPTAAQVEALACLTGFPAAFFYMPMKELVGPVFICGEDGCEVIDNRPAEPTAAVVPLTGRGRLL